MPPRRPGLLVRRDPLRREHLVLDVEVVGRRVVDRRGQLGERRQVAGRRRPTASGPARSRLERSRTAAAGAGRSEVLPAVHLDRLRLEPVPRGERPRPRRVPAGRCRPSSAPRRGPARPAVAAARCRGPGAGGPGRSRPPATRGAGCRTSRSRTRRPRRRRRRPWPGTPSRLAVPAVAQVAGALVLGQRVQPRRVDPPRRVRRLDQAAYGVVVRPGDLADLHRSSMTRSLARAPEFPPGRRPTPVGVRSAEAPQWARERDPDAREAGEEASSPPDGPGQPAARGRPNGDRDDEPRAGAEVGALGPGRHHDRAPRRRPGDRRDVRRRRPHRRPDRPQRRRRRVRRARRRWRSAPSTRSRCSPPGCCSA